MKDGITCTSNLNNSNEALGAEPSQVKTSAPGVAFDVNEFTHFLSETDWSEAEKIEYATLVWEIVCEFVAMGFALHPLQLAQESSGKLESINALPPKPCGDVVNSAHQSLIREFVSAGDASGSPAQKESR